ncbi:MAG: NRDE family protein [Cycloclasticus sp.]
MCLILFAYDSLDQYKLVLLANRDEYHQRKSKQANFWPGHPTIFGGIDCVAGGSWLSVDTSGRLAAITNVRKPPFSDSNKQSRGELVKSFLSNQQLAEDYLKELKQKGAGYSLFNLLLLDSTGLWHYSSDTHHIQEITQGMHGLSNATLDTPWPKLTNGCSLMSQSLQQNALNPSELLSIMQSQLRPADDELPTTGVGIEFERLLSSIFIESRDYGTRCSTLLTIDRNNVLDFCELSYSPSGQITSDVLQEIKFR